MNSTTDQGRVNDEGFLQGVKDCVPTLLSYLSIGFAAGVVGQTAGLSAMEIALMSLLLYAGSAQFIAAGMIAVQSPASAIIMTILFVNLRHLLMSAALSPYFKQLSPMRNMMIGSLLTDETFGVAINKAMRSHSIGERWMHGLNVTAYANWLIANLAGAFFGQWITDPQRYGLDFALTAMFIGLLVTALISRSKLLLNITVAVSAAFIAIAFYSLGMGSFGIIMATIVASTIGLVIEKWKYA